jgi:peptide/nickel transport system ATP-binding protein
VKLTGIPGSPPDLRSALKGCPFIPRCGFATDACTTIDMSLGAVEPDHVTACPFVNASGVRSIDAAAAPARADDAGRVVLEATNLHRRYRLGRRSVVEAVQDVSLELRAGTITALVGESGSGKTTVARLLAGQERRSSGQVLLDGKPIDPAARRGFRAYKSDVQMVFQDPFASLNPLHTVRYHLERALRLHRRGADMERDLDELLTQVRLSPPQQFRDSYPHELSGGQRQRVAIARALAAAPRVLLADEPVSMLDVSIRLEVLDLIEELRRRLDLAVLYITHDIASARYFADEILVMNAGQIVERGPAERVTQQPEHPYTQLLIASAPDPDAFGHQLEVRREDGAMT